MVTLVSGICGQDMGRGSTGRIPLVRRFRGRPFEGIAEAIREKEARLRALWSNRLAYQMTILPEFDEVFRAVQRTLRQANLP